jgi:hypothetical protein
VQHGAVLGAALAAGTRPAAAAAASSSTARAAAPARRMGSDMASVLVLPPVIWMP